MIQRAYGRQVWLSGGLVVLLAVGMLAVSYAATSPPMDRNDVAATPTSPSFEEGQGGGGDGGAVAAAPVGTAFTYQGQLKQGGAPVNAPAPTGCDLEFGLWDDPVDPDPAHRLGSQLEVGVEVANGLFTVTLNGSGEFGPDAFNGDARWLGIAVCCPPDNCTNPPVNFTTLIPRQELTPAPYALALPGLRTEQNATCPNVIGGSSGNEVYPGVVGATISGGGNEGGGSSDNYVTGNYGTIAGGAVNAIGTIFSDPEDSKWATIGGGYGNSVWYSIGGTIGGGWGNGVRDFIGTVGGGNGNWVQGQAGTVGGGAGNHADGDWSAVAGGLYNKAGGDYSFAAGAFAKVRTADEVGGGDTDGDEGTFVWSDATFIGWSDYFESTGPNQFLINAAGGVGVGTNAPQAALHIGDTGRPTWDGIMFPDGTLQTTAGGVPGGGIGGGGTVNYIPKFTAANAIGNSNISEVGGNVGIGVGIPSFDLEIHNNGDSVIGITSLLDTGNQLLRFNDGPNQEWHLARIDSDNTLRVVESGVVDSMVFAPGGNVGIGTTNPTAKLTIGGTPGVDGIKFPDGTVQTTAGNGGSDSAWSLTGNGGTAPGTDFLGTTDDQALQLHVNGLRALRLEPDPLSPNLIGGPSQNFVTTGAYGATIGGGGNPSYPNRVTDHYGTVAGGMDNQAGDGDADPAGAQYASVGGGLQNKAGDMYATVAGGTLNEAGNQFATVGGGNGNTASGFESTVPGGSQNTAAGYGSFAAGERAQANHMGSFVWSDSTTAAPDFFASTGINQFLINAKGGVGIGTAYPSHQLTVESGTTLNIMRLIGPLGSFGHGARLDFGDIDNAFIAEDEDDKLLIHSRLRTAFTGGNVGIGTTSPAVTLDVIGTTRTKVLEITGADLAEKFPVSEEVKPGMVVAIDSDHPGNLCLARGAYNRRVAGVVSGANGLSAGVVLGHLPGQEDAPPIAMSGRVWTWCDTSNGPINPGDLLTTSNTTGQAMRVTDYDKARGAVIGKAMSSLEEETGLVLVLVLPQ